jgi:histidinol dehydrogenase
MKTIRFPNPTDYDTLAKRPTESLAAIAEKVRPILNAVQKNGDAALMELTAQFDKVSLDSLAVSAEEIHVASAQVSTDLKSAMATAISNLTRFHAAQREAVIDVETMPGVRCLRKSVPIERVGFYIPGGTAPLFSTVLMLGVPARVAGVGEKILCSPPSVDGSIHPAILYAASQVGIDKIFKLGGAQAIAAMTFGTASVPRVYKIFGPGNQFVTAAKQLAQEFGVAIDMPAGPSELLVIADDSAKAEFIAADLLSQAEHGADSQVVFATPNETLLQHVKTELDAQLAALPRKEIASRALANSQLILFKTLDDAVAFSNHYAPEHLILATDHAETLIEKIINAGSVFLGHYAPESVGDYASGTNHTLPTGGHARAYSGVSLDSFMRKITFQTLTPDGFRSLAPTVETMAESELLVAHQRAVSKRMASLEASTTTK